MTSRKASAKVRQVEGAREFFRSATGDRRSLPGDTAETEAARAAMAWELLTKLLTAVTHPDVESDAQLKRALAAFTVRPPTQSQRRCFVLRCVDQVRPQLLQLRLKGKADACAAARAVELLLETRETLSRADKRFAKLSLERLERVLLKHRHAPPICGELSVIVAAFAHKRRSTRRYREAYRELSAARKRAKNVEWEAQAFRAAAKREDVQVDDTGD